MIRARVLDWHKRFSEGLAEVYDERPGRAVTARTDGKDQKLSEIVPKERVFG